MKPKAPTKTQIAAELGAKIFAHLKRFERDPKINEGHRFEHGKRVRDPNGLRDYYNAYAKGDRHRVRIVYITYQGPSVLSIEEAARYLAWLDAGNVGRHFEALKR